MDDSVYAEGLRFSCTRCSTCCRHAPGFVFLSKVDLDAMAKQTGLSPADFEKAYCRWVPSLNNLDVLSLREKSNYDCIFWGKDGCEVYASRPLQCRAFPFWYSTLGSRESWDACAADCPGMNTGELHDREEIQRQLDLRAAQPYITRPTRR